MLDFILYKLKILFTPVRVNGVYFMLDGPDDIKLHSDRDEYNFVIEEVDEVKDQVVLRFPSADFNNWLRANISGNKYQSIYEVYYEVNGAGEIKFLPSTFKKSFIS
ncbi:MAG: hypothetical protein ACRCTP_04120 [Aeromonas popoffii]|uniref:hypothetical protein n=1 Tax=Aeromonas popoffii TaxID=70856 RepID=UPI003F3DC90C